MKKLVYVPVAAILLVVAGILFRPHPSGPAAPASGAAKDKAAPSSIHSAKKETEKAPKPPALPVGAELSRGEAVPDTQAIRNRAQALLPGLRPLLNELLVKYPYAGALEEFNAQKARLKAAIQATQDPAAIVALVLWAGEAGDRMEALGFLRTFVLESLRQEKDTTDWIRAKEVSHFLAQIESDGDRPLPARLFALDFLTAQLEIMDPQKTGKIPLSMYCLDQSDLGLLAGALRQSLQRADAQFYQPLLKVIGAYLAVSSVARASITELLNPPPSDPSLRLGLINAISSSQSRILEDPGAFRFLLTGLKEPNDLRMNSAAAMAFAHSPTLVDGSVPEGREVLATLCEQFRGIKGDLSDSRTLRGQQQIFLVSIASADMEGAAAVVKEALLDPSVPTAAKLTALKRIQNIAQGLIGVDHGYQKTGPALVEAITSVQPQFASQPLFPEAIQGCLQSLRDIQKR
jgi:hypothetical protein